MLFDYLCKFTLIDFNRQVFTVYFFIICKIYFLFYVKRGRLHKRQFDADPVADLSKKDYAFLPRVHTRKNFVVRLWIGVLMFVSDNLL